MASNTRRGALYAFPIIALLSISARSALAAVPNAEPAAASTGVPNSTKAKGAAGPARAVLRIVPQKANTDLSCGTVAVQGCGARQGGKQQAVSGYGKGHSKRSKGEETKILRGHESSRQARQLARSLTASAALACGMTPPTTTMRASCSSLSGGKWMPSCASCAPCSSSRDGRRGKAQATQSELG